MAKEKEQDSGLQRGSMYIPERGSNLTFFEVLYILFFRLPFYRALFFLFSLPSLILEVATGGLVKIPLMGVYRCESCGYVNGDECICWVAANCAGCGNQHCTCGTEVKVTERDLELELEE